MDIDLAVLDARGEAVDGVESFRKIYRKKVTVTSNITPGTSEHLRGQEASPWGQA